VAALRSAWLTNVRARQQTGPGIAAGMVFFGSRPTITGMARVPFDLGIGHYDESPPDVLDGWPRRTSMASIALLIKLAAGHRRQEA
jgi:hypothetical protein